MQKTAFSVSFKRSVPLHSSKSIRCLATSKSPNGAGSTSKGQSSSSENTKQADEKISSIDKSSTREKQHKTMVEKDQDLMQKMAGLSGDGGASGVEYEDGEPVAMKRSVRNNMFRYI